MAEKLNDIKADLLEAKTKLTNVAADVTRLHAAIESITAEQPTPEEWAEVKTLASDLKTGLSAVDEATPEE